MCGRTERCRGADCSRRSTHRFCRWAEQSRHSTELLEIFSLGISRHECSYRLLWFWQGFTFTSIDKLFIDMHRVIHTLHWDECLYKAKLVWLLSLNFVFVFFFVSNFRAVTVSWESRWSQYRTLSWESQFWFPVRILWVIGGLKKDV